MLGREATMLGPGEMWIGELARAADVSPATINFYVKESLLPAPRKISRTRAAYTAHHLRVLKLLRRMQQLGYNLAQIRATFEGYGTDDAGLAKIDGLDSLRTIPPPRTARRAMPTEPFDPVDLRGFLRKTGATKALVEQLLAWGMLRPKARGRFDVRDAWVVCTVIALQDDGVPLEALAYHEAFAEVAREMGAVIARLARRHAAELVAREMRFSADIFGPLHTLLGYMSQRVYEEQHPDWHAQLVQLSKPRAKKR